MHPWLRVYLLYLFLQLNLENTNITVAGEHAKEFKENVSIAIKCNDLDIALISMTISLFMNSIIISSAFFMAKCICRFLLTLYLLFHFILSCLFTPLIPRLKAPR